MGKKKRQSDHNLAGDSSDSNDDNEGKANGNNCVHVGKAILPSALRKLTREDPWPPEKCFDCERVSKSNLVNGHDEGEDGENLIYVCLRCGQARCGGKHEHAQKHSKNRQNEVHDVALNPETWVVWCFECNSEIPTNSSKQLLEIIEFLRKRTCKMNKEKSSQENSIGNDEATTYTGSFVLAPLVPMPSPTCDGLPRVRGLANLGNTCFMNATLQCLAQTPFLLPILEEMREPDEKFSLPGGEVQVGEEKVKLDPLGGVLREWGPLTAALADTLRELQSGRSDTFVPSKLRHQLTEKCPQFRGYAEHDSHELLRQLLDTVRTEDLQRYQAAILDQLGLGRKSERDQVTDHLRRIVKGYGMQAGDLPLRPSRVFRGELVSTLVCQKCRHATDHIEHFLDLSLPVAADKPVHVRRRQNEDPDTPSKYQLKKERNAKMHRKSKYTAYVAPVQSVSPDGEKASEESDGESDGDAEDEAEPDVPHSKMAAYKILPSSSQRLSTSLAEDNTSAATENLEKNENGDNSPCNGTEDDPETCHPPSLNDTSTSHEATEGENPKEGAEGGSKPESPPHTLEKKVNTTDVVNHNLSDLTHGVDLESNVDAISPEHRDVVESGYSSEKPGTGDSVCGSPSSERPHIEALHSDMSELHVCGDMDGPGSAAAAGSDSEILDVCAGATLGPRVYTTTGECTLISCLNQFTAQELLTGNNKVGCDACTERVNGKGGKTLYTDASKQLLILSPPAILILHLKRFQVLRFTSRKNSEEVTFPPILDLAPFCSAKCRNTRNVRRDQREIRYALYGVVQHSGNMHGGHYVAYVKVRANLSSNDPRWNFLPGGIVSSEPEDPPEPPPGQWYYVSDSHVTETREARVLDSEGYVLFYERIW